MAHTHSVYDDDRRFRLDPDTREIIYLGEEQLVLCQNDHNSERYTFELPRIIEGHDMTRCNRIQVHYINVASNVRNQYHKDVYEIKDLEIDSEDEDTLICSWLISKNATTLIGSLSFALRFDCMNGIRIDYSWGTKAFTDVLVAESPDNIGTVIEQNSDILEMWYAQLMTAGTAGVNVVDQAANQALDLIEETTNNSIEKIKAVETIRELEDEAIARIKAVEADAVGVQQEEFIAKVIDRIRQYNGEISYIDEARLYLHDSVLDHQSFNETQMCLQIPGHDDIEPEIIEYVTKPCTALAIGETYEFVVSTMNVYISRTGYGVMQDAIWLGGLTQTTLKDISGNYYVWEENAFSS